MKSALVILATGLFATFRHRTCVTNAAPMYHGHPEEFSHHSYSDSNTKTSQTGSSSYDDHTVYHGEPLPASISWPQHQQWDLHSDLYEGRPVIDGGRASMTLREYQQRAILLATTDPALYSQGHHHHQAMTTARPQGGEKELTGYDKRVLAYARKMLNDKSLSYAQWKNLIRNEDPQALEIHQDIYDRKKLNNKLSRLRGRLRTHPDDENARQRAQVLNVDVEELMREDRVRTTQLPMDKTMRQYLLKLVKAFERELADIRQSGPKENGYEPRLLPGEYAYQQKESLPEEQAGNAQAQHIINVLQRARTLLGIRPYSRQLPALVAQIDNWMRENTTLVPNLELPIRGVGTSTAVPELQHQRQAHGQDLFQAAFTSFRQEQLDRGMKVLTVEELNNIYRTPDEKEHFIHSLFE